MNTLAGIFIVPLDCGFPVSHETALQIMSGQCKQFVALHAFAQLEGVIYAFLFYSVPSPLP